MKQRSYYIREQCYELKIGQEIIVDRHIFEESFVWGFPTIYNNPIESFLSGMIGSAWGSFRVSRDLKRNYIISRHEESYDKRVYVCPDRR